MGRLLERLEADHDAVMNLEVVAVLLLQHFHLSADADALHLPKRRRPGIHLEFHAVDLDDLVAVCHSVSIVRRTGLPMRESTAAEGDCPVKRLLSCVRVCSANLGLYNGVHPEWRRNRQMETVK
jgi:hypothetical protein